MRNSPHPLSVHLGMAAAHVNGMQGYSTKPDVQITQADVIEMVRGIKMYQDHPFTPDKLPVTTIWKDGGISVNKPSIEEGEAAAVRGTPLLIVPSLINRGNILDISKEQSMLRWLRHNGIDAYLLDWGDMDSVEERAMDMDALIQDKLQKSIQSVSKLTGEKIDVMGYCMGGTLLVSGYPCFKDHIRRMVLLAAPWDFHVEPSDLYKNVRVLSSLVLPEIRQRGVLPADWMQSLFIAVDPKGSSQKFIRFSLMDQSSLEAKLFVSVEDWLNDGVDLPGNVAQECIERWFVGNELFLNKSKMIKSCDKLSDLDVLVIASENDAIIPYESALGVTSALSGARNVKVITPVCGHIGLIIGSKAKESVWKPVLNWLKS
ncbi:MAG: hypothetical protein ACRBB3_00370 [Alphaproteobacteria bacterium]